MVLARLYPVVELEEKALTPCFAHKTICWKLVSSLIKENPLCLSFLISLICDSPVHNPHTSYEEFDWSIFTAV